MQHLNRPSQWLLSHVDQQDNPPPAASRHSSRFVTRQQIVTAVPVSQEVPIRWNQEAGLHPGLPLGPDDTHDPLTWLTTIVATRTGQDHSGSVLAQSTTGATSISDIPGLSTAQDNHVPALGASGYYYTDLHEQPQDHAWPSRSPPRLFSSVENAPTANRTFQCKWLGCRSVTSFCRESELIRHLKTVHISPKAYPCTEPMCGMAFGRRDHLKAHQRNRHSG